MSKGKKGRQIAHHIGKQLDRNHHKQMMNYAKNEYDKPTAGDVIQ